MDIYSLNLQIVTRLYMSLCVVWAVAWGWVSDKVSSRPPGRRTIYLIYRMENKSYTKDLTLLFKIVTLWFQEYYYFGFLSFFLGKYLYAVRYTLISLMVLFCLYTLLNRMPQTLLPPWWWVHILTSPSLFSGFPSVIMEIMMLSG